MQQKRIMAMQQHATTARSREKNVQTNLHQLRSGNARSERQQHQLHPCSLPNLLPSKTTPQSKKRPAPPGVGQHSAAPWLPLPFAPAACRCRRPLDASGTTGQRARTEAVEALHTQGAAPLTATTALSPKQTSLADAVDAAVLERQRGSNIIVSQAVLRSEFEPASWLLWSESMPLLLAVRNEPATASKGRLTHRQRAVGHPPANLGSETAPLRRGCVRCRFLPGQAMSVMARALCCPSLGSEPMLVYAKKPALRSPAISSCGTSMPTSIASTTGKSKSLPMDFRVGAGQLAVDVTMVSALDTHRIPFRGRGGVAGKRLPQCRLVVVALGKPAAGSRRRQFRAPPRPLQGSCRARP